MSYSIRLIISCLFLFSFICESSAKEDKIKFSKYIVYEGEVQDKEPHQRGVLTCQNPEDKDTYVMRIEGKFSGSLITNAKITTNECNGFAFEGTLKYEVNVEDKDNPCLNLTLGQKKLSSLSHDNIDIVSSHPHSILVRDLPVSFIYSKSTKSWSMKFGEEKLESTTTIATIEQMPFPLQIKKFGYNENALKGVKCTVNVGNQGITAADRACTYIFDDTSTFCSPELSFYSGGKIIVDEKNWYGTHILRNGVSLTKKEDSDECVLKYKNGKYQQYEGTLSCNSNKLAEFFGRNATSIDSTLYYNGKTTDMNDKIEKWFYGESFSARHQRWMAKYDADLVDSLENELMTEKECIASMKQREEMKIEQERIAALAADSVEMAKTKKLLLTHWNIDKVAFLEGNITNWHSSNILAKTGLEPKYLTGHLTLTLKTNKEALFSVIVGPSMDAHKEGLQILSICNNELSKDYKGIWSFEDNKILINNEDLGLSFSSDGKSIIYNGIYGGTLNVPGGAKNTAKSGTKTTAKTSTTTSKPKTTSSKTTPKKKK